MKRVAKPLVSATEQSLSLKKLELEIKQLEADLQKYDERLVLSDQKLRSDVRDWYWRIVVALVSTMVGVVTFVWTQSYQHYTDDFKSVSTRIEEDDKDFTDALQRLSDSSISIRLAAADSLVSFAEMIPAKPSPPTVFQGLLAVLTGKTDSTEMFDLTEAATLRRKINAIQAAADRLNFEPDVRVMESLGRVVLAGSDVSVPYVAEVNRSLANGLTRDFGSLIAANAIGRTSHGGCEDWASSPDLLQAIDDLTVRIQMPYQSAGSDLRFTPSLMFLHSFSVKEFVTIQCNLNSKPQGQHLSASDVATLRDSTIRDAKALALTSYVLTQLLQSRSSKTQDSKRIDLEGVQLVTGTGLDTIKWANADLDNAYLPGTPVHFSCRGCSFRFAALQDLDLNNGSTLTDSDMTGAHFQ